LFNIASPLSLLPAKMYRSRADLAFGLCWRPPNYLTGKDIPVPAKIGHKIAAISSG
jgi:hypothetical protein